MSQSKYCINGPKITHVVRSIIGSVFDKKISSSVFWRRQRGSVVRVGNFNAEDLGTNPRLGLQHGFVVADPKSKFFMLLNIASWFAFYQLGFLTGEQKFNMTLKSPLGELSRAIYLLISYLFVQR